MKLRSYFLAGIAVIATAVLAVQAQVPGVNSTLNSVFTLAYDNGTMKPTYSASRAFTPPATLAQDICSMSGSATKNIRVRRVFLSLIATTAVTDPVALIKRSTFPSSGAGSIVASTPYDANNSAATAVMEVFTTSPTVGTYVGTILDPHFSIGNLTTGGAANWGSHILFGDQGSPIVLRGAAQSLHVNLNGGAFPGLLGSCGFEWTEE